MTVRNNIDYKPILVSFEQRLIENLTNAYDSTQDRRALVDSISSKFTIDGASILLDTSDGPAVVFKESEREDDVEFEDIGNQRVVEIGTLFKHKGLSAGASQMADSGGRVAAKASQWADAAGSAAGLFPYQEFLSILKNNKKSVVTGQNMFSTNHTDFAGGTYSNLHIGSTFDVSSDVSYETAAQNLSNALAASNTRKMASGLARPIQSTKIFAPRTLAPRLRLISGAQTLPVSGGGIVANTYNPGFSTEIVEIPELSSNFTGVAADDKRYYVVVTPYTGINALIYVDREGFYMNQFSPLDSATLNRTQQFQWIARFRDRTVPGSPDCIHKCGPA